MSIVPHQEWINNLTRPWFPGLTASQSKYGRLFYPMKSFIYSIYVTASNPFPSKLLSWWRTIRIYTSCYRTHSRCRKCRLWWRNSHLWRRKNVNIRLTHNWIWSATALVRGTLKLIFKKLYLVSMNSSSFYLYFVLYHFLPFGLFQIIRVIILSKMPFHLVPIILKCLWLTSH